MVRPSQSHTQQDFEQKLQTIRTNTHSGSGPSRRSVLQTAGVALTAGSLGLVAITDRSIAAHQMEYEQHDILEGTQYETTVYTLTSPNEDEARTAMIFGGIHGNERGGIDAAHLATDYTINRGKLVVIPEANKPAVERNNNHGPEGDLNRQFPVNESPTTDVAQGLWDEILRVDPELIIDMHTSTTLYQRGSVGQAIFPTSGVIEHAENTVGQLNNNYMSERVVTDLPDHGFRVGSTVAEKYPLLIHKAAGDENIAGWLTEVTRIGLSSDQRMFLHDMMTRELLRQSGIDVISAPLLYE